ncbi:MAG: hypothetical protein SFW09_03635 [Hyphomicrobiaceae bacterium]|nr:hypothetical protein [Hyphomicrobiaceae bacterium]
MTPDNEPRLRTDDALAFDIGYALAKAGVVVKDRRRIEALRSIATDIVAHLRLCRWTFRQLPPPELHGSSQPRPED